LSVPPADAAERPRRVFLAAAFAIGLGLIGLLVWLSDTPTLLRTAAAISPGAFALPVCLTVLSYAAMSRSYQGIADAAGCELRFRDWLRITFVSNTVNYLVTSAGLSGFAVRMFLLSTRAVPSGRAVLISLVQTFLTNFTLLLFILLGFATLVLRQSLPTPALAAASAAIVVFASTLAWAVVLFFIADAGHRILRRLFPRWTPGRVRLWRFQHRLNEGLEFLLSRKERMLVPAGWIMLDWVLTIAILWAAFRAVNHPIPPGLVMVGFAVGIVLSLVSFVPGGLGVMEGSMTAIFVGLGVPFENAFLAVLIFRVAYYVLPLVLSFVLFHGLMLQAAHGVARRSRAARFDTSLPPPI
jgi:uncharacterized protein (TIRG00374 family)